MKIHDKVRTSFLVRMFASIMLGSYIPKAVWYITCNAQNNKGIEKYGHSIDDCPDDKYDWKIMAIEELVDFFVYKMKAKSNNK